MAVQVFRRGLKLRTRLNSKWFLVETPRKKPLSLPAPMKKNKRTYSVYLGGELFSLKHLIGNAWLAEAIYEKSHGRFRCMLPQDFTELRGRSGRAIRDFNLRALAGCDLALFNFD